MIFLTTSYLIFSHVVLSCESKMEPFVVGGVYTTITEFPHCIYLAVDCSRPWICGASVLNQKILITAAHCVNICDTDNPEHLIEAFAGHENLEKVISKREIGLIKFHDRYDERSAANDIALAGLKKSLYLGQNIKRIVISPQFPDVNKGEVAGWGIVDYDETSKHWNRSYSHLERIVGLELINEENTVNTVSHVPKGQSYPTLLGRKSRHSYNPEVCITENKVRKSVLSGWETRKGNVLCWEHKIGWTPSSRGHGLSNAPVALAGLGPTGPLLPALGTRVETLCAVDSSSIRERLDGKLPNWEWASLMVAVVDLRHIPSLPLLLRRSGDSGSALIAKDYTQLGLVSFRSRRLPALMVYTNITYYYDWIHHNARKLYCQIFNKFPDSN